MHFGHFMVRFVLLKVKFLTFSPSCEEIYKIIMEGRLPDYAFGLAYYKLRAMTKDKRIMVVTDSFLKEKTCSMGFEYAENIDEAIRKVKSEFREAQVLIVPYGAKTTFIGWALKG